MTHCWLDRHFSLVKSVGDRGQRRLRLSCLYPEDLLSTYDMASSYFCFM